MRKIMGIVVVAAVAVSAHFQVIYTPEVETNQKSVDLKLFFTHPYDGNTILLTGRNEQLVGEGIKETFLYHNGKKIDLTAQLKKGVFKSNNDSADVYDLTIGADQGFKTGGNYCVMVNPYPYWEPEEGLYIHQITKLFINRGGLGDIEWADRITEGYTEMIPLVSPYGVTPGSIFRAKVVDSEGKPVEGAMVEIEYLNYGVDTKKNLFGGKPLMTDEKRGMSVMVTDANGIFSFIPLKSGWWGFAALSAGSEKTYRGKDLEQDPVLWIKVNE